ncbi:hypothetical protein SCP_0507600 [Sparassis crispa]|uniref:C2H2-type domain-containing protein n=1 Tax=Sparassis crispa TaxID=139825 RepID=A0A401GPM1_9APHY|nr:hypothetical protein SCP_0507600 [Sparassis crispa]GBE83704.1 hypothetical protein SCP_0507600 [Sparassis crispa]
MAVFCSGCKRQFTHTRGLSRHQSKCSLYRKHVEEQIKIHQDIHKRLRIQAAQREKEISRQTQIPSTQTEEQDSGLEAEFGGSSMPEDVPKAETMQQPLTEAARPLSFHADERGVEGDECGASVEGDERESVEDDGEDSESEDSEDYDGDEEDVEDIQEDLWEDSDGLEGFAAL